MQIDDDLAGLIDALVEARLDKKAAEEREAAARSGILQLLGDDTEVVDDSGRPVLTASSYTRKGVNAKRLEALYPDVYAEVMSETEVRTVRPV